MGTNYYLHKDICNKCSRHTELHLGKSSMGWKFLFQGMNSPFIHSVVDWKREMKPADKIFDEYGKEMTQKVFWEYVDSKQREKMSHENAGFSNVWKDSEGYEFSLSDFS